MKPLTLNKMIGYVLLLIAFTIMFLGSVASAGWKDAIIVWSLVLLVTGLIYAGISLLV